MKKLSLLMVAILILGCGNDTEVVEEPVIEETPPVIEEPPSVVMEPELSHHPLIARGTVKNGEVNVDPELLNREGLEFEFTENISGFSVELIEWDDANRRWESIFTGRTPFYILPISKDHRFKYDTEYQVLMYFYDSDCKGYYIAIQFRTKPRRPVVGQAAPVIQERIPVAPLGERFQLFDIAPAQLVAADVRDGDDNVAPEPLNANGIQFEFDESIKRYEIDLRLHEGASLGWLPRGLVKSENPVPHIKITPAEGFPLLEFDTAYQIDIFVEDLVCLPSEFKIVFRTKPKP